MRESDVIDKYLRPLALNDVALGLRDDAACITLEANVVQVVTTDMLHEGVHFLSDMDPYKLAYRALAVNVSDIAAMGALPMHYQLALGLSDKDEAWIASFCRGLQHAHELFNIQLSGGDTISRCKKLTISVTAFGTLVHPPLTRSQANVGDLLCVSGTLGDAMLGLHCLQHALDIPEQHRTYLIERFEMPTPRIALGKILQEYASACMDISDGVVTDCRKLCAASGVGAVINYDAIPLSDAAQFVRKARPELSLATVSGGDDYELLFTLSPKVNLNDLVNKASLPITVIGEIAAGKEVNIIDNQGVDVMISQEGYQH